MRLREKPAREPSMEPITLEDLDFLASEAIAAACSYLRGKGGDWPKYIDRVVAACLVQGAARHFVATRSAFPVPPALAGVNDFDLLVMFEALAEPSLRGLHFPS